MRSVFGSLSKVFRALNSSYNRALEVLLSTQAYSVIPVWQLSFVVEVGVVVVPVIDVHTPPLSEISLSESVCVLKSVKLDLLSLYSKVISVFIQIMLMLKLSITFVNTLS